MGLLLLPSGSWTVSLPHEELRGDLPVSTVSAERLFERVPSLSLSEGAHPSVVDLYREGIKLFPKPSKESVTAPGFGWFGHLNGVPLTDSQDVQERRKPNTLSQIRDQARIVEHPGPFAVSPVTREERQERGQLMRLIRSQETSERVTNRIHLYRAEVPIRNLSPEFDGVSILHLSDIHFQAGWARPIKEMRALAAHLEVHKSKPDITVITGDVTTNSPRDLDEPAVRALDRIAPESVRIFVDGNHDYYGDGISYVRGALRSVGYRDVSNEHLVLKLGGASLNIFGMSDHLEGKPEIPSSIATTSGKVLREGEANILLVHNLDTVRENMPDIHDLILSGHFHGGEIRGGEWVMRVTGYSENLNGHFTGWKSLTRRAVSHVSPGIARHWGQLGVKKPGATLITLRALQE